MKIIQEDFFEFSGSIYLGEASQVLPGLRIAVLEEALRRSREVDQSQVGTWLLSQFQV